MHGLGKQWLIRLQPPRIFFRTTISVFNRSSNPVDCCWSMIRFKQPTNPPPNRTSLFLSTRTSRETRVVTVLCSATPLTIRDSNPGTILSSTSYQLPSDILTRDSKSTVAESYLRHTEQPSFPDRSVKRIPILWNIFWSSLTWRTNPVTLKVLMENWTENSLFLVNVAFKCVWLTFSEDAVSRLTGLDSVASHQPTLVPIGWAWTRELPWLKYWIGSRSFKAIICKHPMKLLNMFDGFAVLILSLNVDDCCSVAYILRKKW